MKKSKTLRAFEANGYENVKSIGGLEKYFEKELIVFEIATCVRFAARVRLFRKQNYIIIDTRSGFRTEIIWDERTKTNRLKDFLFKLS